MYQHRRCAYVECKDGQRIGRRDGDGLITYPHPHYEYENASNSERLLSGCAGFFTLLSLLFLFMNIVFSWKKINKQTLYFFHSKHHQKQIEKRTQEEKRTLANHLIININQWNLHILLFWIWSICLLLHTAADWWESPAWAQSQVFEDSRWNTWRNSYFLGSELQDELDCTRAA